MRIFQMWSHEGCVDLLYKILSAVLAWRHHLQLAEILPDSQAGFRPARGTRDNVYILKWTVNMILREDKEAVITFIDYKAAFDTESQRYLDNALSSAGVSVKVRRLIQSIFRMASGCIRIGSSISDSFDISRGVLQGDIFSPVAFIGFGGYSPHMTAQMLESQSAHRQTN